MYFPRCNFNSILISDYMGVTDVLNKISNDIEELHKEILKRKTTKDEGIWR